MLNPAIDPLKEAGLPDDLIQAVDKAYAVIKELWLGVCVVYPMGEDGSAVIDIRGKRPDGIAVFYQPDGRVYTSGEQDGVFWNGTSTWAEFPDATFISRLQALR